MPLSNLTARYLPVLPLSDGFGMCVATWEIMHLGVGYPTHRLAVMQHGVFRNHPGVHDLPYPLPTPRDLEIGVLEAMADAYADWARAHLVQEGGEIA